MLKNKKALLLFDKALKLLLGIFSFFSILLIAEGGARLSPLKKNYEKATLAKTFFLTTKTHPRWGWAFIPNADAVWDYMGQEARKVKTHFRTRPMPGQPDYGMRDNYPNPAADKKILTLGDSFTFGMMVEEEEIWCHRIQKRHTDVDFINAAIGGGVIKSLREYRDIADFIPHDTVIYALWLGNEFTDNSAFPDHFEPTFNNLHRFYSRYGFYASRSVLVFSLTKVVSPWLKKIAAITKKSPAGPVLKEYKTDQENLWIPGIGRLRIHKEDELGFANLQNEFSSSLTEGLRQTEKALGELKQEVLRRGKKLIVFMVPFKEQIYFDLIPSKYKQDVDVLKPNKIMAEMCLKQNIQCFDLYADLYTARARKLYWDYDIHFTPEGHEVTAEAIEKILLTGGVQNAQRDAL